MMQDEILQETKGKMQKAVQFTASEFSTIHTGRASAALVEGVAVEVYGSTSRLKDIAAITTSDARTIVIQPWDKGTAKAIEKALLVANLGFTPVVDSGRIRCVVPEMSMERRKEMAKRATTMAESCRIAIRGIRQEVIGTFRALQKAGTLSEDDLKRLEKEVQKLTDDQINEIGELLVKKEKELLTA
jgi:ribosome recycling factor